MSKLVTRLLLSIAGIAIVVIGGGLWMITRYASEHRGVLIEVEAAGEVTRGVPFELNVTIENTTDNVLKDALVTLDLPEGLINLGAIEGGDVRRVEETLGVVGKDGLTKKTYKIIGVGKEDVPHSGTLIFSYSAENGSHYERKSEWQVTMKKAPLEVEMKMPEQVMNGSAFDWEIFYRNIGEVDFRDVALKIEYPKNFKVLSSNLGTAESENEWLLGEVKAKSSGSLEIKGMLEEGEEMTLEIPVVISVAFLGRSYAIFESNVEVKTTPSPLRLEIVTNGEKEHVAKPGEELTYDIQYSNMSGIPLANTVLKVMVLGEVIDRSSMVTNGERDATATVFTWNAGNVPDFRMLEPGASGKVSIKMKIPATFSVKRLNDKNFVIRVNAEMESPSVPYYMNATKTKSLANVETKVGGVIAVETRGLYRDANAGVVNSGSLPPKVGMKTQYTIRWIVKNFTTDVEQVVVSAKLEEGVVWTGIVKTNGETSPRYDEKSKEVRWEIANVAAGKGIMNTPLEAVFQIEAIPQARDAGKAMPLLGETSLQAIDSFTKVSVGSIDGPITTQLTDDPTVSQNDGIVLP